MRSPESKIISFEGLRDFAADLREKGQKIVTTNGCFDLLHLGHLQYLRQARALGDLLLVLLNSDASVKRIKGEARPIQKENVRLQQLAALEAVDYVTLFEQDTPEVAISRVCPSIHVKGGDYSIEEIPEKRCVEAGGGKLVLLPFVEGFSTTELIKKISRLK